MEENKEQVIVQAETRTGRGKNDSRRVRVAGRVPVTIYGGEGESISATADLADLARIIRSKTGLASIFKVAIDGVETEVMFHDRQIDPLRGRLMHADLKRVVRGQKMDTTVMLELIGDPVGVRVEGGLLEHVLHELQIRCRPSQIPQAIQVDVSGLNANEVLHVSDLKLEEDVEILSDSNMVVAMVRFAKAEEEEILPSDTVVAE